MEQVIVKMRDADVIVLATPVYFYTMCAQMKTMIDRTLGGEQKAGLENKEFYLIATAADGKAAMERTINGLRGYIECLPGAKEKGAIYGTGAFSLVLFKKILQCGKHSRWGKTSVDIDQYKK